MIPKIIHYCWFGRGEMPELAQECIESWHRYMPDWEYRLWNEDSFDIESLPYVKEAYEARKYAFVSDYVRLHALASEGGLYLDTDVEALKPFDDLLDTPAFIGYETSKLGAPGTAVIGSERNGEWISSIMSAYEGRHFLLDNREMDLTTNVVFISKIMARDGFVNDGKRKNHKGMVEVYPSDYFYPLSSTRVLRLTDNTYCIHHFAGSWKERTKAEVLTDFITTKLLGTWLTDALVSFKRRIKKC